MSDNSDSEYESEDDEDYVPDEPSSEDDIPVEYEAGKKTKKSATRKRKGGIKLDDEDEISNSEVSEEEDLDSKDVKKDDLKSKQKVEDLWEAFKKDTANVRPTRSLTVEQNAEKKVDEKKEDGKASTSSSVEKKEVPSKKVEVTEIFDFAGEEVKIVKSVDASSLPSSASKEDKTDAKTKTTFPMKRPGGGLGSVLGKIGKKPKLSTLEKSKLDWDSFKKVEGIEDELKSSNRDGFLEKQAFLSRVDHNQFEIERDIRQGVRKR